MAAGERTLREGDLVFVGERLRACPTEAVLKTDDAGMIAVRPRTEFVAERFSAQGERGDGFVMQLFVGSLRIISGWWGVLARQSPGRHADRHHRDSRNRPRGLRPRRRCDSADGVYRQGTFDKVESRGTTLESAWKSVDIDPGRWVSSGLPASSKGPGR